MAGPAPATTGHRRLFDRERSTASCQAAVCARRAAHSARLYDLLLVNDFTGLAALVESFFASIPHQWYTNNDIASYEGFYASVEFSKEARNLAAFDVEQA